MCQQCGCERSITGDVFARDQARPVGQSHVRQSDRAVAYRCYDAACTNVTLKRSRSIQLSLARRGTR